MRESKFRLGSHFAHGVYQEWKEVLGSRLGFLAMIWLLASLFSLLKLPESTMEIFSSLRILLSVPVLLGLAYRLFEEREISVVSVWITIVLLFNSIALLNGSITVYIWTVLMCSFVFGAVNLTRSPVFFKGIPIFVLGVIVVSVALGEIYGTYFGGVSGERIRLVFLFKSPQSLALLCSLIIIWVGFETWPRRFLSTILFFVIFESQTRSAIVTLGLVGLLALLPLWEKGRLSLKGVLVARLMIILHFLLLLFLFYLTSGSYNSVAFELIDGILSGRLSIWENALNEVGLLGGIDPSLDWLRGGIRSDFGDRNRAEVDSFFVGRWLEQGILFLPEYFLIMWCVIRVAKVGVKREILLVIFVFWVGVAENIGIGFGSITSLAYTSCLLNIGLYGSRASTKAKFRRPNQVGALKGQRPRKSPHSLSG